LSIKDVCKTYWNNEIKKLAYRQGCKSRFEVGEAILREGPYFIIFWGAYATFSPSWKILGGAIDPVAPRDLHPCLQTTAVFLPPDCSWHNMNQTPSLRTPFMDDP